MDEWVAHQWRDNHKQNLKEIPYTGAFKGFFTCPRKLIIHISYISQIHENILLSILRKHWEGLAWRLGDLIGRRVIFTLQGFEECRAHVELICVHHAGHRVGFPCWMHSNRPKGLWSLDLKKQSTSIFVHLVCLCCASPSWSSWCST